MRIPLRIRLLLVSAYFILALIIAYLAVFVRNFLVYRYFDPLPVMINLLVISPFLFNSSLIILFIRRFYPSGDIAKSLRISYFVTNGLTVLLLLMAIYSFIDMISSTSGREDFARALANPIIIILLSAMGVIFVLQIFMNIEGARLLRTNRYNNRNDLIDNF